MFLKSAPAGRNLSEVRECRWLSIAVGRKLAYQPPGVQFAGADARLQAEGGGGAGGLTGGVLAGLLWSAGWRGEVYLIATCAAALALIVAWRTMPSGGARAVAPAD